MRKFLSILTLFGTLGLETALLASSTDYNSAQSAAYIRTLNRNASTDGIDIISTNPAGTTSIADGLHFQFNNLVLPRNYGIYDEGYLEKTLSSPAMANAINMGSTNGAGTDPNKYKEYVPHHRMDYQSEAPSLFVPNMYLLFKHDDWALFMAQTSCGAGGMLDYKEGTPTFIALAAKGALLNSQKWGAATKNPLAGPSTVVTFLNSAKSGNLHGKLSSSHLGITGGGAYSPAKFISISLAARYVYVKKRAELFWDETVTDPITGSYNDLVNAEMKGQGISPIVSVNIAPTEYLNFALRYEAKTTIKMKVNEKSGDPVNIAKLTGYYDGREYRSDFPAILGAGIAYKPFDNLKIEASLNYYFLENAFVENAAPEASIATAINTPEFTSHYKGERVDYQNGYDTGLSAEIGIAPSFKLSFGFLYTKTGADGDDYTDIQFPLNYWTFAGGFNWQFNDRIKMDMGIARSIFSDKRNSAGDTSYHKVLLNIGAAVETKIF